MPEADLIIRGRQIALPGELAAATIHIKDGRIAGVGPYDSQIEHANLIDVADDLIVMPGLVDTHVHINSPGRSEWEGFGTATQAAAAGGVTTLVDMPLNSIPATTTANALHTKVEQARNACYVDLAFWGGLVPGNTAHLAELWNEGVVGFKCFLVPSGVDEFPNVDENDLRTGMRELARLGAMLIVHAELPGPIAEATTYEHGKPTEYDTFLASRPKAAENQAVDLMIKLSREFDTPVHIVHLSSAEALPHLHRAQQAGVRITAETCPHYLYFSSEAIPAGATEYKCCPPIRERENREDLWRGLAARTISIVVSDHSPCPGELKLKQSGNFVEAWGGISSLQLRLPVVWTSAVQRKFAIPDLVRWLCQGPSEQVGLVQKGKIAAGMDADLVIWAPEETFKVDSTSLLHRHQITPYNGETLRGVVKKTFLRGRKIYDGSAVSPECQGQLIFRGK